MAWTKEQRVAQDQRKHRRAIERRRAYESIGYEGSLRGKLKARNVRAVNPDQPGIIEAILRGLRIRKAREARKPKD